MLEDSLGILVAVEKQREIYYIGNIKIHIDIVKELGSFIEIEASDEKGNYTKDQLHKQCSELMTAMEIREEDLVQKSYSDLIMERISK